MNLFWRYQLSLMGGFLAMSAHFYLVAGRGAWFAPQRIGNAISAGLMFGHVVAVMVLIARDVPRYFQDRWPAWGRWLVSIVGGIALGTLAWWSHITLILLNTRPDWRILLVGGIGLSLGFILTPVLWRIARYTSMDTVHRLLRTAALIAITAIATYVPIYLAYQNFLTTFNTPQPAQAMLYFQVDNPEHVWLIGVPFALSIAFFGQAPMLFGINSSHRAEP